MQIKFNNKKKEEKLRTTKMMNHQNNKKSHLIMKEAANIQRMDKKQKNKVQMILKCKMKIFLTKMVKSKKKKKLTV